MRKQKVGLNHQTLFPLSLPTTPPSSPPSLNETVSV